VASPSTIVALDCIPGVTSRCARRSQLLPHRAANRAIERAQREGSLDRVVRTRLVERVQRADQRVGVSAETFPRAGDRRRDGQPVEQRIAEGSDLPVRVQAVTTGRALRTGEAETAFPRAQRIRADIEQRRSLAGLQVAHHGQFRPFRP
jgi:hypothetical protein